MIPVVGIVQWLRLLFILLLLSCNVSLDLSSMNSKVPVPISFHSSNSIITRKAATANLATLADVSYLDVANKNQPRASARIGSGGGHLYFSDYFKVISNNKKHDYIMSYSLNHNFQSSQWTNLLHFSTRMSEALISKFAHKSLDKNHDSSFMTTPRMQSMKRQYSDQMNCGSHIIFHDYNSMINKFIPSSSIASLPGASNFFSFSHKSLNSPTNLPTASDLTTQPTLYRSELPTYSPSQQQQSILTPTIAPSIPTITPSLAPIETAPPSGAPSETPISSPSESPSRSSTSLPNSTQVPYEAPSSLPTLLPSSLPSTIPSQTPTATPTVSDEALWLQAFNLYSNNQSKPSIYQLRHDELIVRNKFLRGDCPFWTIFTNSVLLFSMSTHNPISLSIASIHDYSMKVTKIACTDRTIAHELIENLILYDSPQLLSIPCGNNLWNLKRCLGSSTISLCINCSDPCIDSCFDDNLFKINSCNKFPKPSCSWGYGRITTLDVIIAPISPPPSVSYVAESISSSSITEIVSLSGNATLMCGIFPAQHSLASLDEITIQNNAGISISYENALLISPNISKQSIYSNYAVVYFKNLRPSTSYSLYCYSEVLSGIMPLNDVKLTRQVVSTLCCKHITVDVRTKYINLYQNYIDFIVITLNAPPSQNVTLHLSTTCGQSSEQYCDNIHPSSVSIFPYSPLEIRASIARLDIQYKDAIMKVRVSVSGVSSNEFDVKFVDDRSSLNVITIEDVHPAPVLIDAIFSDDSTYVLLKFDSLTNLAEATFNRTSFKCSLLLHTSNHDPQDDCIWKDAQTIALFSNTISIGDTISVLPNLLRAKYVGKYSFDSSLPSSTHTITDYDRYNTSSPDIVVKIRPSDYPRTPILSISGPSMSSICDDVLLDLTGSIGNGGRLWRSINVTVVGSNADVCSNITEYIMKVGVSFISVPTPIPSIVFNQLKGVYWVSFTICNFLNICGSRNIAINVVHVEVPYVSILGSSVRSIKRSNSLSLSGYGYTALCSNGMSSRLNLQYLWTIWQDGVQQLELLSQSYSKDPSTFKLRPFTLLANKIYTVRLDVINTQSYWSSFDSTSIVVDPSNVIASVSGGSSVSVKEGGGSVVLDASSSSFAGISDSADLYFSWSCIIKAPFLGSDCNTILFLSSLTSPIITVTTCDSLIDGACNSTGIVATVTVTVYVLDESTPSSSASVEINVVNIAAPVVQITTSVAKKINVDDKIKINAFVISPESAGVCSWSLEDSYMDFKSRLLTNPIFNYQATSLPLQLNLVIMENTFLEGSTFILLLTCNSRKVSSASIAISINIAPLPGKLSIDPDEGLELSTQFLMSANFFTDDDLPMSYLFGFKSPMIEESQVLRSRNDMSYTHTALPAGSNSTDNVIQCFVSVYDNLDSSQRIFSGVKVYFMESSVELLQNKMQLFLDSSGSISDSKNAISLVTSVANRVSCSFPPDSPNCDDLNRQTCSSAANLCGPCLPNYFGISGDSNTACQLYVADSTASLTQQIDKTCPLQCSMRGTCRLISLYSNSELDHCSNVDDTCIAKCFCDDGYGGSFCESTLSYVQAKTAIRSSLISKFHSIINLEDPDDDSIISTISTLLSLSLNQNEIDKPSALTLMEIAQDLVSLMHDSNSYFLPLAVLSAFDNAMSSFVSDSRTATRNRRLVNTAIMSNSTKYTNYDHHSNGARRLTGGVNDSINLAEQSPSEGFSKFYAQVQFLETFSSLVLNDMVAGEFDRIFINKNYRITAKVGDISESDDRQIITSDIPKADYESYYDISFNESLQLVIPPSKNQTFDRFVKFSLISLRIPLYSDSLANLLRKTSTNPLMVFLDDASNCNGYDANGNFLGCTSKAHLINNKIQDYVVEDSIEIVTYRTECKLGIIRNETFRCKGFDNVTAYCNGLIEGYINVTCPYEIVEPRCDQLLVNDLNVSIKSGQCQVSSYKSNAIDCTCPLNSFANVYSRVGKRMLSSAADVSSSPSTGSSFIVVGSTNRKVIKPAAIIFTPKPSVRPSSQPTVENSYLPPVDLSKSPTSMPTYLNKEVFLVTELTLGGISMKNITADFKYLIRAGLSSALEIAESEVEILEISEKLVINSRTSREKSALSNAVVLLISFKNFYLPGERHSLSSPMSDSLIYKWLVNITKLKGSTSNSSILQQVLFDIAVKDPNPALVQLVKSISYISVAMVTSNPNPTIMPSNLNSIDIRDQGSSNKLKYFLVFVFVPLGVIFGSVIMIKVYTNLKMPTQACPDGKNRVHPLITKADNYSFKEYPLEDGIDLDIDGSRDSKFGLEYITKYGHGVSDDVNDDTDDADNSKFAFLSSRMGSNSNLSISSNPSDLGSHSSNFLGIELPIEFIDNLMNEENPQFVDASDSSVPNEPWITSEDDSIANFNDRAIPKATLDDSLGVTLSIRERSKALPVRTFECSQFNKPKLYIDLDL